MTNYLCVNARFLFFNGVKRYTVEFTFGLSMWFIFEEEKNTDALFKKKIIPSKSKSPNREEAEYILLEYLDQ